MKLEIKNISANSVKEYIIKHYYLVLLLIVVVSAFYVRAIPARFNELPGLDEFYFYRISDYALKNNLQLPVIDTFRYHPFGIETQKVEFAATAYIPVYMYLFFTTIGIKMHYFTFVLLYPPIMGALAALAMFLLGKELYDYKAGLLSALFLATIPAFINRTSAGIIEKEAAIAPLMIFTLFFFMKAFKTNNWKYGIISGLFLALTSMSSAIAQYFLGIISIFALGLLVLNKNHENLMNSYFPTFIVALFLPPLITPHNISILNFSLAPVAFSILVFALVGVRYSIDRFNLIKKEYLPYIAPAFVLFGAVGFLLSTIFLEETAGALNNAVVLLTLKQIDPIGFTVAENQPGNWNSVIESASATLFASSQQTSFLGPLSPLIPYLSIWLFMLLGLFLMLYKIGRRREFVLILPVIWAVSSIWSVFYQIRLLFIFGPVAALIGGYFLAWFINKSVSFKNHKSDRIKALAKYAPFYLGVFVGLIATVNFAAAYSYTNGIGPSICFANPQYLINGQKCLELDANGNVAKYAEGQPWYQAMSFLEKQTPENSNIISWWDFGYWFQTRGKRPSVSDGGYGPRKEIADWFTADVSKWDEFEPWLKGKYGVDYILMDYTLPGKYGAITAIESGGTNIQSIAQFQQTNQFPEANRTILEFTSGPFAIWIPFRENNIAGTPVLLQSQGGRYAQIGYINDICTSSGITKVGNEPQNVGGCVAVTNFGIFYLNKDIENTIFARLMFMDGAGLPIEKVFDNALIKIYEVKYEELASTPTNTNG